MRFTEDRARLEFAGIAIHAVLRPQPILALGEILAERMRQLNGGYDIGISPIQSDKFKTTFFP